MNINIIIEEISDTYINGLRQFEVAANGISVGIIDINTARDGSSVVTKWTWNGNFAPDDDWPQESGEPCDTDQLMEDIATSIRHQLKKDAKEWSLHGVDNITAKASPAATI